MRIMNYVSFFLFLLKFPIRLIIKISSILFNELNKNRITFYPRIIQLPITYKCNFDCVMCGMRNLISKTDFSALQLSQIISDRSFKKVRYIGLNGGEPFLKDDLIDCVRVLTEKLPVLDSIGIISNGYFTDKMMSVLPEIKRICVEKGVNLNLTLSIDAVGELQDFHRGKEGAFENFGRTLDSLLLQPEKYYDCLDFNCTITKYNIFNINEVVIFAEKYDIPISYNIASPNKRIDNEDKIDDFYIFNNELARKLAMEFFYKLFKETGSKKYFAIFLFLRDKKRYDYCPCRINNWITITPDSNISFCASHSKLLGSALCQSTYDILRNNKKYLKSLWDDCQGCSSYVSGLNFEGEIQLRRELTKERF